MLEFEQPAEEVALRRPRVGSPVLHEGGEVEPDRLERRVHGRLAGRVAETAEDVLDPADEVVGVLGREVDDLQEHLGREDHREVLDEVDRALAP